MDHHTAEHPAGPQTPAADSPLRLALTYRLLVSELADVEHRPESVLDLPSLEHAHVAAILQHWRQRNIIDALADSASLRGVLTHFLADRSATIDERSQLVGVAVIASLRDYFAPLLLKDVQAQWDLNREADRCENPFPVAS